MNVTGGRILFRRTVKPADFEGKAAEVELSFGVGEGEDVSAALSVVDQLVFERAMKIIFRPDQRPQADGAYTPTAKVAEAAEPKPLPGKSIDELYPPQAEPENGPTAPTGDIGKRHRRTKAEMEAARAAEAAAVNPSRPTAVDPAAMPGENVGEEKQPGAIVSARSMGEASVTVAGISDVDLHNAAARAREKGVPVDSIRDLISRTCAPNPASMAGIPQDRRAGWLQALKDMEALT